jgi:aminoglycoside phosphotransferase (APT) family kinase protein
MADRGRLTGLLDWANVRVGDRRADLARTLTLMRLAPLPPGAPAALNRFGRHFIEAAWRQGYRWTDTTDAFADLRLFYVWAGALMERDMRPKLGRPGVWLQESDLARIREWTDAQARTCVL